MFVPVCVAALFLALGMLVGIYTALPLFALAGIGCVLASIAVDIWRSTQARVAITGESWVRGLTSLALWNRRRYGGFIVHLGVVAVVFGILASGLFQETKTLALAPGERFEIGGYTLEFNGLEQAEGPNWAARQANVRTFIGSDEVEQMQPQRRNYPKGQMTTTESAIRSTLGGDLYVVLGDELGNGRASLRAYFIPLVGWIWAGWFIIIFGSLFALSQGRAQMVPARVGPEVAKAATP